MPGLFILERSRTIIQNLFVCCKPKMMRQAHANFRRYKTVTAALQKRYRALQKRDKRKLCFYKIEC